MGRIAATVKCGSVPFPIPKMPMCPVRTLLKRLSQDLQSRLGRGFSERNLEQMRQFYLLMGKSADVDCGFENSGEVRDFADTVCEIGSGKSARVSSLLV